MTHRHSQLNWTHPLGCSHQMLRKFKQMMSSAHLGKLHKRNAHLEMIKPQCTWPVLEIKIFSKKVRILRLNALKIPTVLLVFVLLPVSEKRSSTTRSHYRDQCRKIYVKSHWPICGSKLLPTWNEWWWCIGPWALIDQCNFHFSSFLLVLFFFSFVFTTTAEKPLKTVRSEYSARSAMIDKNIMSMARNDGKDLEIIRNSWLLEI